MTRRETLIRTSAAMLLGTGLFAAGFYTGGRVERAHAGTWDKIMDVVAEARRLNNTIQELESNIGKLRQNASDLKQVRDKLDPTYKKGN